MADLENIQSSPAPPQTVAAGLSARWRPLENLSLKVAPKAQLILVLCTAIFIAAAVSHFAATWLGLPSPTLIYRRIGPQSGPQAFCAGSSVVQFGLSWPQISETLGQGIENWGLGGSTPEVWEISQSLANNTNLMIIGVSVYDLNEHHLCDARGNIVPMAQTIQDLWRSRAGWQFSKRLLSQYPLTYLRKLFPTSGRSDAVLMGLRRKLGEHFELFSAAEERANSLVLPRQAVLNFGESEERVSDWSRGKILRRLALTRTEIQGMHWFGGPKKLAFLRMLQRAQQKGRVIVVVMPIAPTYAHEFLTPEVSRNFEAALTEAQRTAPAAWWVRLDQLPALNSDQYFGDFVHLNSAGRQIATEAFFDNLKEYSSLP